MREAADVDPELADDTDLDTDSDTDSDTDTDTDSDTDIDADPPAPGAKEGPSPRAQRRLARWLAGNGWLILAAGAALVLTNVVEFEPPELVRIDETTVDLVGEAPKQEFSANLGNPQAVQLRGTLRLYPRGELDVREPNPDVDAKAQIISQPVVTTIYAMNATIDQTVRLDNGRFEIDVNFAGTPRLGESGRNKVPELSVEHELTVQSREKKWLGEAVERVHLHTRGTLTDIEDRPYRWVFMIEDRLFALDLELSRAA